jgi:hypothetical protein
MEIIRRASKGQKNVEIADALNMHPVTISCVLRSPLARAELARLSKLLEEKLPEMPIYERLQDKLEAAAVASLELNAAVVQNNLVDIKVRTRVASHFLDKVVFKEQEDDTREASYKDILRSVSNIEQQLRTNTVQVISNDRIIEAS